MTPDIHTVVDRYEDLHLVEEAHPGLNISFHEHDADLVRESKYSILLKHPDELNDVVVWMRDWPPNTESLIRVLNHVTHGDPLTPIEVSLVLNTELVSKQPLVENPVVPVAPKIDDSLRMTRQVRRLLRRGKELFTS